MYLNGKGHGGASGETEDYFRVVPLCDRPGLFFDRTFYEFVFTLNSGSILGSLLTSLVSRLQYPCLLSFSSTETLSLGITPHSPPPYNCPSFDAWWFGFVCVRGFAGYTG